jgi:ribosomal protein S18 acetylase RimI-like enzyme
MAATRETAATEETPPTYSDTQTVGTIWVMDLNASWPAIQPAIPATFDRIVVDSADALAATMSLAGTGEVRRRLESGRRCYITWVAGELVAYGWVSFDEEAIGGLDLRVRLLPGEAYIWDCATLPAFRRRGLYSALLTHMLSALCVEGLRRVWIGADFENWPSQVGIARAGFMALADIVASPVLPGQRRRRAWLQARPAIAEGLVAEARRVYMGDCQEVWLPGEGA